MAIDVRSYRKKVKALEERLAWERRDVIGDRYGPAALALRRRNARRVKSAKQAANILNMLQQEYDETRRTGVRKPKLEAALERSLLNHLDAARGNRGGGRETTTMRVERR